MNIAGDFDAKKTLEVLLYIAHRCPDMYTALKVLFYADKAHLARYGRLVSNDRYKMMEHGPVPSGAYDLVKDVRDLRAPSRRIVPQGAFHMNRNLIVPDRHPDLDALSESDVECLDGAIAEYGGKTFNQLKKLSHDDPAAAGVPENEFITLEGFVKSVPDGEKLWSYLTSE